MRWLVFALVWGLTASLASVTGACALPGLDPHAEIKLGAPSPGGMTLGFGTRAHPLVGSVREHHGLDFAGPIGTPVHAAAAGIVIHAGSRAELGNAVEIAHGGGHSTVYAQLSTVSVQEGQCVAATVPIGAIGCSGLCAAPHLHFEIRRHGQPVDPSPYLTKAALYSGPPVDWRRGDAGKLLDAVLAATARHFLDQKLLQRIDWKSKAEAMRPVIHGANITANAVAGINALLSILETSHTALFTPDDYEYYILPDIMRPQVDYSGDEEALRALGQHREFPSIGAFTRQLDGRHFIDGVLEGSAADTAGLRYGDEIVNVDGQPYRAVASFRGKVGQVVNLSVRRSLSAEPAIVRVEVKAVRPISAFGEATKASARIIERGGKRVGYIHVWSSMNEEAFRTALSRIEPGRSGRSRMQTEIKEVRTPDGKSQIVVNRHGPQKAPASRSIFSLSTGAAGSAAPSELPGATSQRLTGHLPPIGAGTACTTRRAGTRSTGPARFAQMSVCTKHRREQLHFGDAPQC